jgi:DNA-binding CsgD family transcriptional regulator
MGRTPAGQIVSRWLFVGRDSELAGFRAALADPGCDGLLVYGNSGVGKTRFAEECLAAAAAARTVARAATSTAGEGVPLGALAHLMPLDLGAGSFDPPTVFARVASAIRARSAGAAVVLFVDDLPLLDRLSLVVLSQLIADGAVFLLGTADSSKDPPTRLSGLWHSDRLRRIELVELPYDAVEELVQRALGGAVEPRTVQELWSVSRGNPLLLRELILGAQAAGALAASHGVWRITTDLPVTNRLAELVATRIAGAGTSREALDLLALAGPASVTELAELTGPAALEHAERAGLVAVQASGRRTEVTLAHPVFGRVLRDQMATLTRRRLLRDHANWIGRRGGRRREDPLRLATWRLEVGDPVQPGMLLQAARLARYGQDFALVERLVRAAGQPTTEARLLLGEACYALGRYTEAEQVLAAAQQAAADQRQLAQIVAVRADALTWGLLQPAAALAAVRSARVRATDPAALAELLVIEATIRMNDGQPAAVLDLLAPLHDHPDPRVLVLRAIPHATALLLTGHCETALAAAQQGLADHLQLGDQLALPHAGAHVVIQAWAMQEAGRLGEAADLATAGYHHSDADGSVIGCIWFALLLGHGALLAGRIRTAQRWFAQAETRCRDRGYDGPRQAALAGLATTAAWLGDTAAALAAIGQADHLTGLRYLKGELDRARAWAAAADSLSQGRRLLLAAADDATARGMVTSAAALLYDLARLGDPGLARDRLEQLASQCEGPWIPGYARAAAAAAAQDPAGLAAVAQRFEDTGALLFAAETTLAAAAACRRAGTSRRARELELHAGALARQCEGARTPALIAAAATASLTPREREVAMLATRGLTSHQIAAQLMLSSRTVEHHLQHAYEKLGITRRTQLAQALAAGCRDLAT